VVIPRLKSDLVTLFEAVANEKLADAALEIDERSATTVMIVSGGYPEDYEKGKVISGLENVENAIAFHAGTAVKNGDVVTSGGRVIAVTAYGTDFREALKLSYDNVKKIDFEGKYYRTDLGFDL